MVVTITMASCIEVEIVYLRIPVYIHPNKSDRWLVKQDIIGPAGADFGYMKCA